MSFFLVGDAEQLAVVDSHQEKLRKLIGFGALQHADDLKNMPSEITPLGTLYLDLASSVDVEAEKKKLAKQLAKLEGAIKGGESKLKNESYLAKAPPHLVEETRQLLEDNQAKRDELVRLMDSLG
ncbi:MAG: hypothetical protein AAGA45_02680 [Verrucomicrobiota bacterium]